MPTPDELIERLGDADVAVRKAAAAELFDLGAVAVPSRVLRVVSSASR